MTNMNITVGRDISVSGDFAVADAIQNSFNKVAGDQVPDEVKNLLRQLADAVGAMAKGLSPEQAKDAVEEYGRLAEEVAKPQPKKHWFKAALEGLKDVALTVGTVGKPVLEVIEKATVMFGLWPQMSGLQPPAAISQLPSRNLCLRV